MPRYWNDTAGIFRGFWESESERERGERKREREREGREGRAQSPVCPFWAHFAPHSKHAAYPAHDHREMCEAEGGCGAFSILEKFGKQRDRDRGIEREDEAISFRQGLFPGGQRNRPRVIPQFQVVVSIPFSMTAIQNEI